MLFCGLASQIKFFFWNLFRTFKALVDVDFLCWLSDKMQVQPLDQEDPLEKEMATHSSILA